MPSDTSSPPKSALRTPQGTPRSITSKRRSQVSKMKAQLQLCIHSSFSPTPQPLTDSSNVQHAQEPHAYAAPPSDEGEAPSPRPARESYTHTPPCELQQTSPGEQHSRMDSKSSNPSPTPEAVPPTMDQSTSTDFPLSVKRAAHDAASILRKAQQLPHAAGSEVSELLAHSVSLLDQLKLMASDAPLNGEETQASPSRSRWLSEGALPQAKHEDGSEISPHTRPSFHCSREWGECGLPLTTTYAEKGPAVGRIQAAVRKYAVRKTWGAAVDQLRQRAGVAREFVECEREYLSRLQLLVGRYLLPLREEGTLDARAVFGNVQVLLNLSRTLVAQLEVGGSANDPPSLSCASALLSILPSLRLYVNYTSTHLEAQQLLGRLTREDESFCLWLLSAEAQGGESEHLRPLLLAPVGRISCYRDHLRRLVELTPPEGRGGDVLARALASISELCTSIDFSLEEGESRYKVGLLHSEFGEMLGPPMAHRRFVYEGELAELVVERGRTTATRRNVILFNDGLLLTTGAHTARDALECISLAKVQVKLLPERTEGGAIFGFELWSMAKIWRFAAPSEEERRVWVKLLQKQIRFLLASFKQRGKSLAFLPQNVTVLREQLDSMQQQQAEIEEQVQRE
ncbi:MAG: hypothetical protein SGPRY_004166 [Prymnesium sp.]